jgi:hypothetical protein
MPGTKVQARTVRLDVPQPPVPDKIMAGKDVWNLVKAKGRGDLNDYID